jgi:hypothetical protein
MKELNTTMLRKRLWHTEEVEAEVTGIAEDMWPAALTGQLVVALVRGWGQGQESHLQPTLKPSSWPKALCSSIRAG